MDKKKLYKTVNDNGVFSCGDVGISAEEWLGLLCETGAQPYLKVLYYFLREPRHTGSCKIVGEKYGDKANYYNGKVTSFSKWVQKKLNRFRVVGTTGKDTYWCITMLKGWESKQGFQWQMREELVEALQAYLMKDLIRQFSLKIPFDGFEEENKWNLLDNTEGKGVVDIVKSLRGQNIVDNARVDSVLKHLWETKPADLTNVMNSLLDESKSLDGRLASFKEGMRVICPSDWKKCANDERTASAILMCRYPQRYTVYKDEIYQLICRFFGFEKRKAGQKFIHFMEIINNFAGQYGEDVQKILMPHIGKYRNKPLNLAVQTLFWCMRSEMRESLNIEQKTMNEDTMPRQKYKEYIDLLHETHNLVLTGAPGTGKTFMAQQIAKEMGAVTKLVQFHPSYDYTDFVEGLRPVIKSDGQMGFERKDGVFKIFCREAIKNLVDTGSTLVDSPLFEKNVVEPGKPFVFIIDEINRGEASKIFGELFYAIDPGYRGKKECLVQTQYQNLVPEADVFANGFYVPENVYILATMNDIDRSVESMDFAMRRRFTWKEVTPADTEGMLDSLPCADKAKDTMRRLNEAIADADGLGDAYMIGPSYFLKLEKNGGDFGKLWKMNIEPLLKEYLRGFRKSEEILETFSKAFFGNGETEIRNTPEIVDED